MAPPPRPAPPGPRKKRERPAWVLVVQMVALAALSWALYWYGPAAVRVAKNQVQDWVEEPSRPGGRF